MTDTLRWKVQAAIVAKVTNPDPAFDPVAFVNNTIATMATQAGFDVTLVGETSARRYYEAGDSIMYDRPVTEGRSTSTRPEYGLVVLQGGTYYVQFADGFQVPLPERDTP